MPKRLHNKTALVTAAGQGIGRAIAQSFIAEGATVWATDIDPDKLATLSGATLRGLDVTSSETINALAAETGPIDILVNAAGFVHHGSVLECTDAEWDFSFDVNVKSMHRTVRAFVPGMLERGKGTIVNISSGASSVRGLPNRYAYGASKAAVIGLTKAVAADFMRRGIRANAICPGTVDSPSLDGRIASLAEASGRTREEVRLDFINRQPMGRLGTPEEIAMLAVYLASEESSFTTGSVFMADGGFSL